MFTLKILFLICLAPLKKCNCELLNAISVDPGDTPLDVYVLWPNATVPFYINKDHFDLEQVNIILSALQYFQIKTCLKFMPVPTTPMSNHHVLVFENPDGVNRFKISTWGHSVDEPHIIRMGYNGLRSPYLEMMIMKALGFPFEHNRKDRNDYISIQNNNIEQSYMQHFTLDPIIAKELLQLNYDYNSVMHFKSYQFTKNGQRTYTLKNRNITYDNMLGLTSTDLLKIKLVYEPECLNRDRKEKVDICQQYKNDRRRKRSIYVFPRKSLRVNPDITPPPMLDSAELDRLNISDVVKEITEHVQVVSGLIVKIARAKFCNASLNDPYDYSNDDKIKEAVTKIEHYAHGVIELAQMNSKNFCDATPNVRACGFGYVGQGSGQCTPRYKSTKSENIIYSTQYKAIPVSTNLDRLKQNYGIYYPYPQLHEGEDKANVTATSNVTEVVKEGDGGNRTKREADNEINEAEEYEQPSRRLVRKLRKKSTHAPSPRSPPPTTTTTTEMPTETTKTTIRTTAEAELTDAMKPKAEEDDYEVVEYIVEDDSVTEKIVTKPSPSHQKRFKKKYVARLQTDNKEEDMANFNQHLVPTTTRNTPRPAVNKDTIIKQFITQKQRIRKTTPAQKKIQNDKYESIEVEKEVEEDKASGIKNVKVIMEYNTAGKGLVPTQLPPQNQLHINQKIMERQEAIEEGNGSNASQSVEESVSDTEESDNAEKSNQVPAVIPEDQLVVGLQTTPSPEIVVNQFQPDTLPTVSQHRKRPKQKPKEESSAEEEEERPTTTRKPHKPKKAPKPPKTNKGAKPPKTRIIAPEAASVDYQTSGNIPKTIKLNTKNLEFYNERKWNEDVIPYVLAEYKQYNTQDLRRRMNEAIRILKKKTCVRLQEVSLKEADESFEDYLIIDTSPDYVTGRVGGKQHFGSVELFEGGQHRQHTAMMIMAMLGFYFEVARHDRDHYVRVHLRHVRADKLHHFEKIRDDATFPLPYDYKSATHPAWQFWRKLGKKGISTVATYKETDPSGTLMKTLGQNPEFFSEYDIIKINTIYGIDCFLKSGLIRDP